MNNIWYKQLGFHNNPFSIKPAAFHDELYGYEDLVAKVIKAIEKGSMVFIEGPYGEGKTTILKHVLRYFGGHKKVIYFSVNRVEKRIQIRRLLNERYGRLGRWLDIRPKDMILLLDEVQELDKKDVDKMLKFKKEGNFKSFVFVSSEFNNEAFPDEVMKQMTHVKLEKLKDNDAVRIVRKRIGDMPILGDDVIKKIFLLSGNNARNLLKNCELLCKKAVDYGSEKVSEKMLEDFFGEVAAAKEEPKDEKIFLELEDEEKAVQQESSPEEQPKEIEEEKTMEELEEDVGVIDPLESDKKEFMEHDEIDEELSKMEMEEESENVKISNGTPKAVAAEEALGKDTDDILDKHYY